MSLPIFQSDSQEMGMLQTKWATELNPLLNNPLNNSSLIRNVALVVGTNIISHKLGRKLQGWKLTRVRGPAAIYDTQDANSMPQLTLSLVSSAVVTVDIEVF